MKPWEEDTLGAIPGLNLECNFEPSGPDLEPGVFWNLNPIMMSLLIAARVLFKPRPQKTSLDQRLAVFPTTGLPVRGKLMVHWDDHQIPFIEAEHDDDAAFALGLVHAHLRLGQMAISKRIAQGRISEMGGPLAADIDHGLRILDFGRTAKANETAMPDDTRQWLKRFVDGVNHYQATVAELPFEYAILKLEREPWTIGDILTFGRLSGSDVNWLVWFTLLKLRRREDWPEIWAWLLANGGDSVCSFEAGERGASTSALLAGLSRSGSNSLAIGRDRTATGGAIMANDPHLGIYLPNTWLLAGLRSSSYHAVGLMTPGLPIFAIGRNPWISWGGTNMRCAASDLCDVSNLSPEQITTRHETIRVRGGADRTITLRETPWGPILSDAPQLKDLGGPSFALRWTGHQPSDEITAMLGVNRARNFAGFRDALKSFGAPGQNMLYADHLGNIGQVMATRVPDRGITPPSDIIARPDHLEGAWKRVLGTKDLPFSLNPSRGFLASANNRPADTHPPVGYFFSPDDRVNRMANILRNAGKIGVQRIQALQMDVHSESSVALRDVLVKRIAESGIDVRAKGKRRKTLELLIEWDGCYEAESRGALAFELFRHAFTMGFYEARFGMSDGATIARVGRVKSLLLEDIERRDSEQLSPLLENSLAKATGNLRRFRDWGDMHRLRLAHPLAFLPVIGKRFRFADHPVGGTTEALMKTAHSSTSQRHFASYGSNARHISDLADMDRNYFLLLGGQDGWINSDTFQDQVPAWLSGNYIEIPMRPHKMRALFRHRMELTA